MSTVFEVVSFALLATYCLQCPMHSCASTPELSTTPVRVGVPHVEIAASLPRIDLPLHSPPPHAGSTKGGPTLPSRAFFSVDANSSVDVEPDTNALLPVLRREDATPRAPETTTMSFLGNQVRSEPESETYGHVDREVEPHDVYRGSKSGERLSAVTT